MYNTIIIIIQPNIIYKQTMYICGDICTAVCCSSLLLYILHNTLHIYCAAAVAAAAGLVMPRIQWNHMRRVRQRLEAREKERARPIFEPATFPRLLKPKTLSNRLVQTFHSRCMYDRFGAILLLLLFFISLIFLLLLALQRQTSWCLLYQLARVLRGICFILK